MGAAEDQASPKPGHFAVSDCPSWADSPPGGLDMWPAALQPLQAVTLWFLLCFCKSVFSAGLCDEYSCPSTD